MGVENWLRDDADAWCWREVTTLLNSRAPMREKEGRREWGDGEGGREEWGEDERVCGRGGSSSPRRGGPGVEMDRERAYRAGEREFVEGGILASRRVNT